MKKLLSLLLASSIVAAGAVNVFAAPEEDGADVETKAVFSDISDPSYEWAYSYIQDMVERGYITGYEDNTFRPDNSVTRLEVLAQFARALGSGETVNEPIVEAAMEQYQSLLSPLGLTWGQKEIAFLMYRGVLTESDLATYLRGELKNQPMPRYESAIIITKAMGGEKEATKDPGVMLDYTDQRDIPSTALQYVAYVSENGIMNGMEDGTFSPNSSVRRSQMAVMLSRTVDKMEYSFVRVKLNEVDTAGRVLVAKDADGKTVRYTYRDDVSMKVSGEETLPRDMIVGVNAVITLSGKKALFVDTLTTVADEEFYAKFVSRATTASQGTRVTMIREDTGERRTYTCASNLSVLFDESPSSLLAFSEGTRMYVKLEDNEITYIKGETKTTTITGATLASYTLTPEFSITIEHPDEEFDGTTYTLSNDVRITKNGADSDFTKLYIGDKVTLTLEYGIVKRVTATSTKKVLEGTINSISKSMYARTTFVLRVGGEDYTYEIPDDVEVFVADKEATVDDLRLGDVVKVTLESQAIKKIVKTAAVTSQSGSFTGMIQSVVPANKFITVLYDTGTTTSTQAIVLKESTVIMNSKGQVKKIGDLEAGQVITIYGEIGSSGAYTANMIVIDLTATNQDQ